MSTDHPTYQGAITLFLEEHGPATLGRLQYHIAGRQAIIEACLAEMMKQGQIEACGIEQSDPSKLNQVLYCLKRTPYWQEQALIGLALDHANEELLGLHRKGVLTYSQYTDIASLLVAAREKLKTFMQELKESSNDR